MKNLWTLCPILNSSLLTINANQELNVVMFHRSYHFVQELKANSLTSESGAKGIGI